MSRGVSLKEGRKNDGRSIRTQAKYCFRNEKRVNSFRKEELS